MVLNNSSRTTNTSIENKSFNGFADVFPESSKAVLVLPKSRVLQQNGISFGDGREVVQ